MNFPIYARGSRPIPNGVDHDSVTGLGLSFVPAQVLLNVKRQTGILSLAASPRTATITADGFDFDLSGLTDNSSYVLDYLLLHKSSQFSFGSVSGVPSAFQGVDPVLGPPYAPIDYQLFINPIIPPDSFAKPPGADASLFWTVPNVAMFAYSLVVPIGFPLGDYSFWTSLSSAPSTAVLRGTITTGSLWIPAANYIWATHPAGTKPTNPGFPIAEGGIIGTNFLGTILYNGNTVNPGNFPIMYIWEESPPDSIDHFELRRGTDGVTFPDSTNSFIPGPPRPFTITDPANRDGASDYFYQMTGVTANGLRFPYNVVAFIHPYPLAVSRTSGVTLVSWPTPNLTNFP